MADKPVNGNRTWILKAAIGMLVSALLTGYAVYLKASPITQAAVESTARKIAREVVSTQSPYLEDRKLILQTLERLEKKLDRALSR